MFVPHEKNYVRIAGLFLSVAFLIVPAFVHASFFSMALSLFGGGSSLDDGLIAYWTFDGKNMISSVANSVAGSNSGALTLGATGNTSTTTTIGSIGQALVFDGLSDYVNVGVLSGLGATTKLTVSAWIRTDTLTGGDSNLREIVSQTNTFTSTTFIMRFNTSSDQAEFLVGGTGSYSGTANTGTNSITANTWYHVVGVYDGANVTMYINGVAKTPVARTGVVGNASAQLHIGNAWRGGFNDRYFSGAIDDVRVYNRALSAGEISRLYLRGSSASKISATPGKGSIGTGGSSGLIGHWTFDGNNLISNVTDSSQSGYNGTIVGQSSTTTSEGVIGQALSFDGANDFVELGRVLLNITIPVSISLWVKPNPNAGVQNLFHSNTPNTDCCNYRGVWMQLAADNTVGIHYGSGTANTSAGRRSKQSTATLPDGEWTHVVAVIRGATDMTIYFNGVDAGGSYSGTGGALNVVDDPAWSARIGWGEQGTISYYDGLMDDVRFYGSALSDEEINRLYSMGR